jgi:hypothetical protein
VSDCLLEVTLEAIKFYYEVTMIDELKTKLTVDAALTAMERLEVAIANYDHRKIGAELYNLKRELHTLKTLLNSPSRMEKA